MTRIVISDNMDKGALEKLGGAGEITYKPENLESALADADVLVVRSATKVTKELLDSAKSLKMVARAGVGLDNIDQEACREKGIEVVNAPGASTNAVAEMALGLIIGLFRNIQKGHHQMKDGRWEKKSLMGSEINGKTLGIIGYGRIGSAVGKKAHALGMKIIAYNPPPRHEDDIVEYVDNLDDFLSSADVFTIHAALTDETRGMVNSDFISKMRDGSYLVNLARGEMVDEDALFDACKSGKLAGAALDVYPNEPYSGKLCELENVAMSPHIGGSTKEAQANIGAILAEKIKEKFGS